MIIAFIDKGSTFCNDVIRVVVHINHDLSSNLATLNESFDEVASEIELCSKVLNVLGGVDHSWVKEVVRVESMQKGVDPSTPGLKLSKALKRNNFWDKRMRDVVDNADTIAHTHTLSVVALHTPQRAIN